MLLFHGKSIIAFFCWNAVVEVCVVDCQQTSKEKPVIILMRAYSMNGTQMESHGILKNRLTGVDTNRSIITDQPRLQTSAVSQYLTTCGDLSFRIPPWISRGRGLRVNGACAKYHRVPCAKYQQSFRVWESMAHVLNTTRVFVFENQWHISVVAVATTM